MLDIDLNELGLFPTAAKATGLKPAAPGAMAPIEGAALLEAVTQCWAELEELLARCEHAYRTTRSGRTFAERIGSRYRFHTRKGDTTTAQVQRYCIRDGVQWVTLWIGQADSDLWRCLPKFVGFTASLDDLCIPPADIQDGTYTFAGETLTQLLARIQALGGPDRDPRWLEYLRKDVRLAAGLQFYEKWAACPDADARCPEDLSIIKFYTTEPDILRAAIIRNFDTMTPACLALVSYYFAFDYDDCDWALFYAAAIGDALALDVGKDAADVGVKCPTNLGARPEHDTEHNTRRRATVYELTRELSRPFRGAVRLQDIVYGRYSRIALSFAQLCERYLERRDQMRIPPTGDLADLIDNIAAAPADFVDDE
ncbi:hypothetical protein [Nonomuraea endophytica]|uniref:hypothetical protein n=1 Tax=Nonomuraea endophytica TaxID=714136 RepID=UPI0037CB2A22